MMKRCLFAAFAAVAAGAWGADLVVEPGGLSAAEVLAKVRAARAAGDATPKTVVVRGVNRLTETLVLTEADHDIFFVGEDGAVFSGGLAITDWREAEPGVWEADAPKTATGETMFFDQLWVNGRRAPCARLPNEGWLDISAASQQVAQVGVGFTNYLEYATFTNEAVKALARVPASDLPYLEVGIVNKWSYGIRPLGAYDAGRNEITLSSPFVWRAWKPWMPGYALIAFFNVRSAFDAPGEWFLDMSAGKVRYRPLPGEKVPELAFVAPRTGLSQLVRFRGDWRNGKAARNVSFRNVSFEHAAAPMTGNRPPLIDHLQAASSSDGAITVEGVRNVSFENCRVAHTGNYAMRFNSACVSNRLVDCTLEDLGAGGVWMGADYRFKDKLAEISRKVLKPTRKDSTAFNLISNCTIRAAGRYNPEGTGVALTHCSDTKVVQCDIHDIMYTGISVGWTWGYYGSVAQRNEIAYNRIWDLGKGIMSDMGGIYMLATSFGTTVHDNVIHDVWSYSYGGWGLYADEGSEGIVFERNVCWNLTDGGFHQHFGTGCIVRNNVFYGVKKLGVMRTSRAEVFDIPSSLHVVNNIIVSDGAPLCGIGVRNVGGIWANNLWWDVRGEKAATFDGLSWSEWKACGKETGGVFADPLFVSLKEDDVRLRPDSPALKLGFKPFDSSKAGRRRPVQEYAVRGGAGHALAKLQKGGPFTVAYFGGSITEAGEGLQGWRTRTTKWLRETYPQAEIREVAAAIGGTESTLGAYRLEHDVLCHKPDLMFVEFACNDMAIAPAESRRAMESIVRQTWQKDPKTDIVFAYTITVRMTNDYARGQCHTILTGHQELADRYRIPSVDFGPRVMRLWKDGKLLMKASDLPTPAPKDDPEHDRKVREAMAAWPGILFTNDGVHPRAEGHALYLESLTNLFAAAGMTAKDDHAAVLGEPLYRDGALLDAKMVAVTPEMCAGDWQEVTPQTPFTGPFLVRTGTMREANRPGSTLRFRYTGDACALYAVYGPNGGRIRITVDGKETLTRDLFDNYCTYYRLTTVPVSSESGTHDVEVTLLEEQADRRIVLQRIHTADSRAYVEKKMAEGAYDGHRFAVGAILVNGSVEAPVGR